MTVKWNTFMAIALCAPAWDQPAVAQATPEAIVDVRIENFVNYDYDYLDYTKFATIPTMTTPLPMRTFGRHLGLADIVAVNGKPAMGTCVYFSRMLTLRPDAGPGQAIADVTRAMLDDFSCEFLQPDGTPVGTIMGYGFTHGSPPPGAPRAVTSFDYTIIGGTGAFLGARGQMGYAGPVPGRVASVYEDTANRRVLGGTSRRFILHLIPMSRPEVVMSSDTAALFHADFSVVTQQNPARAGEVLFARATGLGPVRAPIDPGEPFPADPIAVVNSPVEATVNGGPAEVINQVGWPGTRDVYRIDFRVPEGTGAGLATLRLTAAWIPGPQVQFPVR